MKNLSLFVLSLLLLFSCNKDDNESSAPEGNNIIKSLSKRWLTDESSGYKSFQFNNNGTYIIEGLGEEIEFIGKYKLESDSVTITLNLLGEIKLNLLTDKSIDFDFKDLNIKTKKIGENLVLESKYYIYSDNSEDFYGEGEWAEIDINTGEVTWTGFKMKDNDPHTGMATYNRKRNEIIAVASSELVRYNFETKQVTTKVLEPFIDRYIIGYKDKVYEVGYPIYEIDIESGNVSYLGELSNDLSGNIKGSGVDKETEDIITFVVGGSDDIIYKFNLKTRESSYIGIKADYDGYFEHMFTHNNKFYAFCGQGRNELAEIDIINGKYIWTGIILPDFDYPFLSSGYNFDGLSNEFIAFDNSTKTIYKVDIDTKKRTSVKVKWDDDRVGKLLNVLK